jgi:hypothetical protein
LFDDSVQSPISTNAIFYKPGINKSDSRQKRASLRNVKIYRGIHVYLNAKRAKNSWPVACITVRCFALKRDLLGVNKESDIAVFKKVYLLEEDYKKALRSGKNV